VEPFAAPGVRIAETKAGPHRGRPQREDDTMTYPKTSWIIAGAAAAILGGHARATDTTGAEEYGEYGESSVGEATGESSGEAATTEEARTPGGSRIVQVTVDGSSAERGRIAADKGESVELVITRTSGPEHEDLVLPDQGFVAELPLDQPIAVTVRSTQGGIAYRVMPADASGAEARDVMQNEAGNTGGRG
jgi:hypothetical protein